MIPLAKKIHAHELKPFFAGEVHAWQKLREDEIRLPGLHPPPQGLYNILILFASRLVGR